MNKNEVISKEELK